MGMSNQELLYRGSGSPRNRERNGVMYVRRGRLRGAITRSMIRRLELEARNKELNGNTQTREDNRTEAIENAKRRGVELWTHRCMGSHAREVTHFECPFRGSPIGLPVLGSQSLTYTSNTMQRAR